MSCASPQGDEAILVPVPFPRQHGNLAYLILDISYHKVCVGLHICPTAPATATGSAGPARAQGVRPTAGGDAELPDQGAS